MQARWPDRHHESDVDVSVEVVVHRHGGDRDGIGRGWAGQGDRWGGRSGRKSQQSVLSDPRGQGEVNLCLLCAVEGHRMMERVSGLIHRWLRKDRNRSNILGARPGIKMKLLR